MIGAQSLPLACGKKSSLSGSRNNDGPSVKGSGCITANPEVAPFLVMSCWATNHPELGEDDVNSRF
jgi:hypothetical protein